MKIHNIINESQIASEHVKGGLDSYYQLTKAKRLAKADGHDYDKLPEYDRGKDQPHKEKYMALAKEVKEAKGLGKRVKVVKGHFAGEEGTIREIKHGAFKGAPKSYYIDLDNGEMADNLPADVLRLIKRTDEKEKMLTLKDIDNGGKKDVKLTFKRKPDGTPIDKKQPQKEVKEVSDFKKRELEYELRDEEPKSVPSKRRPYRTPQEKIRDAKKRYSKAVGVMKGNTDEGIEEAEGDKCEICNGRGKIDYHSEDGPSKCQKCNGKGVQAWKPEPVNWGNAKVKEDDLNDLRKRAGLEVRAVSEESLHEESFDCDDKFFETYGWLDADTLEEAEYQGRKVKLNKPMQGDVKKFKVYVKDPKTGNTKKVNFGHGGSSVKGKAMKIRKNNPKARKSFRARHNCDSPGPKTKARYWSCRKW